MKALKWCLILAGAYAGLVVAFESLVAFMGDRHADRGLQPEEQWVIVTTSDHEGRHDTVVAGVESGGAMYVAANHWLRGWYKRAVRNPDVEATVAGTRSAYRAIQVTGAERERIAADYHLPWILRFLAGFPPRSYLRLDPQ